MKLGSAYLSNPIQSAPSGSWFILDAGSLGPFLSRKQDHKTDESSLRRTPLSKFYDTATQQYNNSGNEQQNENYY